jgi:hypothetical protein
MAKRLVRAFRWGGNDVTDLDLLVADDHPIDEQFHQPASLLEGGLGESRPHLLAESLDRVGYPGEFGALPGGGLKLAFLGEEGIGATLEFFALALKLGELQYPTQVGLQEPLPLEFGVGDGLAIRSFFTDFRELLKAEVELRRTPSTRSSHAMPVAQLL